MARIHARVVDGSFVYRPYSGILKEYRGEPMSREEIKQWFAENCFTVTAEAEKEDFIDQRIALAEKHGSSGWEEEWADLNSGWFGEKKPIRRYRSKKAAEFTAKDREWLGAMDKAFQQ